MANEHNQTKRYRPEPELEQVESRLLFSAGMEGVLIAGQPDASLDDYQQTMVEQIIDQEADQVAEATAADVRTELIFVDTDVPEYQTLLSDLLTYQDGTTRYEVFELDNTQDGLAQISAVLSGFNDVSAVHILSHGTEGAVDLGGATLDTQALTDNAAQVSAWGEALTENADILIYGCNLAANEAGESLVNSLAGLTGADVAASDDLTGNAALGGDWDLEYNTGAVETSIAVSADIQRQWMGRLATPAGGEFLVNSTTSGIQETYFENPSAVAADASGNFVVVWTGQDADGTGVFAQRYDAAGVAQGSEFRVNSTTADQQHHASVAMDNAGNFVVTWVGEAQDADSNNEANIYAQRYNAAGVAQGGEFRVNTSQAGDQLHPTVAMDADGDFVITWTGPNTIGNDVLAQRYNAAGVAQGGEFQVNSYSANDQQYSSVAMDDAGNFVVTWTSINQDASQGANKGGIYAQRYDAAGVAQGGEFRVNTEEIDDQVFSTVAMDAVGNFVITWTSDGQDGDQTNEGNIYAQRYNAAGVAQGGEFRINSTTAGDQRYADVAMDAAGNFTVTWMSFGQDGDASGESNIYAREYDASGTALGSEVRVNTTTSTNQQFSSVARTVNGGYIIVWSGNGAGDGNGVYGQRYDTALNSAPVITSDGGGATAGVNVAENTTTVTTVTATDADGDQIEYTISGGADAALFDIDRNTGALTFLVAPDFEAPGDVDTDNVYEVEVTADDRISSPDSQLINVTVTAANDAPVGVPTITGTVEEDQTLVADTSGISDEDGLGAFSYQWHRDGIAISGATASTYTLGDADVGAQMSVVVSYTDGQGTAEGPLTSAPTAAVMNINDAPTGSVAIDNMVPAEGDTLMADTSGISDADGLSGPVSYQWNRDGVAIAGATADTYTLDDADVGAQMSVSVSYTDGQGTAEGPLASGQTAAVTNVNDTPTGSVTIDNATPSPGNTLTVNNDLADADGLSGPISYQWYRDGVAISGATAASYSVADADGGAVLTVVASYTDDQGTVENVTSAGVLVAVPIDPAPDDAQVAEVVNEAMAEQAVAEIAVEPVFDNAPVVDKLARAAIDSAEAFDESVYYEVDQYIDYDDDAMENVDDTNDDNILKYTAKKILAVGIQITEDMMQLYDLVKINISQVDEPTFGTYIKPIGGVALSLSAGVVAWVMRGGAVVASLLSTATILQGFDPLPMLTARKKPDVDAESNGDEDSPLNEIFEDTDRKSAKDI